MLRLVALCPILPLLCAASPSEDRLHTAAAQSVALIQRASTGFYKSQDCFSCHGYQLPMLVLQMAREHGVRVDEGAAHAVAAKGIARFMGSIDRAVLNPENGDFGTVGDELIALDAAGVRPNLVTAVYARQGAKAQDPAGYWATLDTRPPSSYSYFTTTAIALRSLQEYAPDEMRGEVAERTARAKKWLLTASPRSTEDLSFRLMGLAWAGATIGERNRAVRELQAIQRPDGGWAQMPYMQSDAYSTGEALMALHEAGGIPVNDPRWEKASGSCCPRRRMMDRGMWQRGWYRPRRSVLRISKPVFRMGKTRSFRRLRRVGLPWL